MVKNTVQDLVRRSSRAVCGITERELNVPIGKLSPTISKLSKAGYRIIGTSYEKRPIRKVWFIRRGMVL